MEEKCANALLNGAISAIRTIAFIEPKPGKPYSKENKDSDGDITGTIGITGTQKGVLIASYSTGCALELASSMMGEDYKELTDESRDAIGEITSIITEYFITELSQSGSDFSASMPSIIVGKDCQVASMSKRSSTAIQFQTDCGEFTVEAGFE